MTTVFMNHVEEQMINYSENLPTFYRWYVDDIFIIFENQCDCQPIIITWIAFIQALILNLNELPCMDVKVFRKDRKYFINPTL